MKIAAVTRITGLSAKQIRDYEKNGLLTSISRTAANYRNYSAEDVRRLQFIAQARSVGFPIAQINELLKLRDNPQRNSRDVKKLTEKHILLLSDKITALQQMKDTLQNWHNCCPGNDSPECIILQKLDNTSAISGKSDFQAA